VSLTWEFGIPCHSLDRRVSYVVVVSGGGQHYARGSLHSQAHGSGASAVNRTGLYLRGSSYVRGNFLHALGPGAALLFISPQRAQVRTCSLGRSGSRTSHSDQSCAPTRQAIMPHMWSPHFEGRARHHNSIAMPVVPNYPTLCGAMAWSKACKVKPILGAEVRRAPFGPGLWPGPCRQARWAGRGSKGQESALA
jgi:hypothetical protein